MTPQEKCKIVQHGDKWRVVWMNHGIGTPMFEFNDRKTAEEYLGDCSMSDDGDMMFRPGPCHPDTAEKLLKACSGLLDALVSIGAIHHPELRGDVDFARKAFREATKWGWFSGWLIDADLIDYRKKEST